MVLSVRRIHYMDTFIFTYFIYFVVCFIESFFCSMLLEIQFNNFLLLGLISVSDEK